MLAPRIPGREGAEVGLDFQTSVRYKENVSPESFRQKLDGWRAGQATNLSLHIEAFREFGSSQRKRKFILV